MKVLGYLRRPGGAKGPGQEAVQVPPLDDQARALELLCQQRGWELVASFVDIHRGRDEGRAFARLLERLDDHPGECGCTLVADLTLLAPTIAEAARRLLEAEQRGAPVLSASHTVGDPLLAALRAWETERESSLRRRRVREGMERKALHGRGLGRPAYGFRAGAGGRMEAVPAEAETVQRIFRLYTEQGLGLRRITNQLNSEKVPTKGRGRWSAIGVRDLLRNRVYLGTYYRFGVRIPGSLPRLVEQELFQAAQQRLASQSGRGQHGPATQYLLSGLLYCGHCQGPLSASRRRHSTDTSSGAALQYYRCPQPGDSCLRAGYPMAATEAAVHEALGRLAAPGTPAPPALGAEERAGRESELRMQLGRLEQTFRRYLDRAAAGALPPASLKEASREPLRVRRALESQLQGKGSGRRRRSILKKLVQSWDELGLGRRRELLLETVERITVGPEGLRIALRS